MAWYGYREYVPVAVRRKQAAAAMMELRAAGKEIRPVQIEGRTIARSFWGKQWCDHMESFHDFRNRLDRGKRYVRNGSVCHLEIRPKEVKAIVSGSELYNVRVQIRPLAKKKWGGIVESCRGRIISMLELLQGRLSDEVMREVTDRKKGLLPQPGEIDFRCDCPDYAIMCKHVAAVFYGIGNRLDRHPELLFVLRDVDADQLIAAEMAVPAADESAGALPDDQLSEIFGIELDEEESPPPAKPGKGRPSKKRSAKKAKASKARPEKVEEAGGEVGPSLPGKKGRSSVRKTARSSGRERTGRGRAPSKRPAGRKGGRSTQEQPRPFRPTGASIARLRKRLGMTVAQFARAAGVTPASVYRWESSKGKLNLQPRPREALDRLYRQAN